MEQNKIIRTVCLFTHEVTPAAQQRLQQLTERLSAKGFVVQTQRLCSPDHAGIYVLDAAGDGSLYLSLGQLSFAEAQAHQERFLAARNVAFNVDLSHERIDAGHVALLTEIIARRPGKTFNVAFTFNNAAGSPFFPSAAYAGDGFAIGLQPTDLAPASGAIDEWLERMRAVWEELEGLVGAEPDFLGVDTSIAPLFEGRSSLVNILRRGGRSFSAAVTTPTFVGMTEFLKAGHVRSTGLCGLMLPCLEDFELADEYAAGNFSIERNLFLALHSGLGIDTYPIGVDERPERVVEILQLVQALSHKHWKPLSARFVSDGRARIGDQTDFGNQYLKDVVVRPL